MNREQIIEEMARKIQQGELRAQRDMSYHENFNFDTVVKIGQQRLYGAKALYEDNYQKIAEGSVVLTEEEIEEMKEQARKETVKQSCNDLIKIIKNNTDLNASVFGWTTDFILNMIKTYFKETFGVEVE